MPVPGQFLLGVCCCYRVCCISHQRFTEFNPVIPSILGIGRSIISRHILQFSHFLDQLLFLIPPPYRPDALLGFRIPGLGVILALLVLIITGVLVANLLGRRLVHNYEKFLNRIPLVRSVYGAVKHFAEVVFSDSNSSFKKVLLIEYPRAGLYSLCFQTSEDPPEVRSRTGDAIV